MGGSITVCMVLEAVREDCRLLMDKTLIDEKRSGSPMLCASCGKHASSNLENSNAGLAYKGNPFFKRRIIIEGNTYYQPHNTFRSTSVSCAASLTALHTHTSDSETFKRLTRNLNNKVKKSQHVQPSYQKNCCGRHKNVCF